MDTDIKLSIIVPVYNHEKYIVQAIESILMQKVNFKYEVLIGEDCSTDSSLALIEQYKDYEQIHIYAREKNMNNLRIRNALDLQLRTKGEYIIALEGDDYWTDPDKLQKQVDFLDSHPDYFTCAHRFQIVNENGEPYNDTDIKYQFFEDNPYDLSVFESRQMLSHVNTLMFRNFYRNISDDELPLFTDYKMATGDFLLTAYLVLQGKMYCLPDVMSCYRKVVSKESSSYSARMARENRRDKLYRDIVGAEKFLNQRYKISFRAKKRTVFASAVFGWKREKTKENFKVVTNIINYSGHRIQYFGWMIYLLVVRFIMDHTGKKGERVKF